MALTVFPLVNFNTSTGSDTAASGAGPATALTGAAGNVTSGSATATITDAVDLSGVAGDGSAVLWIVTASGRTFSRISAISGSSGAWTLTLEDTVWTTTTNATWAIGGKRATFGAASSRKLFTQDAKAGWTIQTETDQSTSATITLTTAAGSTSGYITIQGDSITTHRVITQTQNGSHFNGSLSYWKIQNIRFLNTAGTKSSANAISPDAGSTPTPTLMINCRFGDSTAANKLLHAIFRPSTAQPAMTLIDCEIGYCTGYGLDNGGGGSGTLRMKNCHVHDNAGDGLFMQFSNTGSTIPIHDCIFWNNTGKGINWNNSGSNSGMPDIQRCTFHNNGSDGLAIPATLNFATAFIAGNNFTNNGGYGINGPANSDAIRFLVDYNLFGTGGTANTSGAVSGFTNGANVTIADPGYTNASGGDFSVGTAAKEKGYPPNSRTIGAGASSTYTFVDSGASQRQEASSGGGTTFDPLGGGALI